MNCARLRAEKASQGVERTQMLESGQRGSSPYPESPWADPHPSEP